MAVRRGFLAGEKREAKNVDNVDKPKRAPGRKDARKKKRRFFLHFRPKYEKMEGWRKEKARRAGQGRVRAAARRGLSPKIPGLSPVIHSMDPAKTQAFQGFRLVIHFSPGPTTTTKYLYYYYNNHTGGGRRPPGARGQ